MPWMQPSVGERVLSGQCRGGRWNILAATGYWLILAVFCCLCQVSFAVDYPLRWRWSNPAPHGNNTVDMAYSFARLLAVQVAERGQIYTSDNLDLWLPRNSGTTNALRAVTFLGSRIVVTGENGCVLYADSVDSFMNGTLIDGPTDNWLEAVAASDSLAIAVGDNGAIYTTLNGVNWKKQSAGTNTWLLGVAYGNGMFVIVGEDGYIALSANGTNWTKRPSGTTQNLNRVAFVNGRFSAVGNAGATLISANRGTNWSAEICGGTNDLFHTTTDGIDSRLIVGDDEVRLQQYGIWYNELAQSNGPPVWTYYANLGRPDFYLIAGQTGMMAEGYQTNSNPYFWVPSMDSVRNWLWDVTCLNHLYVAVGDFATVMTSGNGVNWKLELVPPAMTNSIFFGVGGSTNLLVAVGDAGSLMISPNVVSNITITNLVGTNLVVTNFTSSSFGVIWYTIPRLTTNDLQGVTYGNGLYVVTGDQGTVLLSADGTNWVKRAAPTVKLLTSVTAWPGGFVAVGDDGRVALSPNGTNWSLVLPEFTTNWLYRVRYWNGNLIAVGQNGSLYTSTNGTEWRSRSTATTKWLTDAAFIDDTWFVCGYSGAILASTNLTNWSNLGTITKKSFYALATDTRQLVAVGVEGVILRCPVLPDLTPIEVLRYAQVPVTNYPAVQNIYLFGGKPDQRFTLDRVSGFETNNWVTGPLLEILDPSGTLYYLETVFGTNIAPREFYRATIPESE